MTKNTISIIGLGYVGLPLAVNLSHHWNVVGYDISNERVEELKQGIDRTLECDISKESSANGVTFTTSQNDIKSSSIYIITVPTPVSEDKLPDLGPLLSACELVGRVLKRNDLVIFESTVFPGATEEFCVPKLENERIATRGVMPIDFAISADCIAISTKSSDSGSSQAVLSAIIILCLSESIIE